MTGEDRSYTGTDRDGWRTKCVHRVNPTHARPTAGEPGNAEPQASVENPLRRSPHATDESAVPRTENSRERRQ